MRAIKRFFTRSSTVAKDAPPDAADASDASGSEEVAPPPKAQYTMTGKSFKAKKPVMMTRRSARTSSGPQKLFTADEDLKDKLVGVVVTIFEGDSYDEMFKQVRPTTVPGERVSTYTMACSDVGELHGYLDGSVQVPEGSLWRGLIDDVHQVEADSVVFNWECCSSCGDNCFPCARARRSQVPDDLNSEEPEMEPAASRARTSSPTMLFMALALRKGFTVMCSDFSLKSLIYEWSEECLGPNPFLKVGGCDHQFQLEFVPAELQHEDVPQQLQVVGQLCSDQGKAIVSAMGDTLLYTVNPRRQETSLYTLKVLTVATDYSSPTFDGYRKPTEDMKCSVGRGTRGLAGHVSLTYASGGQLVTSMGHWLELTQIDTTLESVLRVAGHEFGEVEVDSFRAEYASKSTPAERAQCVQERAKSMVQKSTPSRMKCRTKY